MSHLVKKRRKEEEIQLEKNMCEKKTKKSKTIKSRHNLEQESPPASLVDSISLSLSVCLLSFFPSFIALLSNNEKCVFAEMQQ